MSDSDIEIKKIAPMKPVKKPPKSPTEDILRRQDKKITTKMMIHEALNELKTRKGVSSYAIKKYLEEKYNVETEKVKYLIKKTLKTGVEDGSIIQLKGIGASGSFKLAVVKEKPKKKPTIQKEKSTKEKPTKEKSTKEKSTKEKSTKGKPTKKKSSTDKSKKETTERTDKMKERAKKVKSDVKKQKDKATKTEKPMEKDRKKKVKLVEEKSKSKMAPTTPAKKKANMMKKRKSIGSIIKPPKMKPKSKA